MGVEILIILVMLVSPIVLVAVSLSHLVTVLKGSVLG